VHIRPGDAVISGSVVEEGRLTITVERVGSETSMARIGRFIDHSLRGKSKTQTTSAALADKLVPVTLGLSGLMLLATRDVNRATSVLTVDFSCAVKLASPVAVRSGMYAAGQAGVLLKGACALDALQDVDTIVFDKTGTLTTGQITVTDILPEDGLTQADVLALAAGAEEHYDHPVARAVVREAKQRTIALPPISRVDFIVAHGVAASVDGKHILVGSHHFVAEDEGVACAHVEERARKLRRQGKSLLYVAREGKLAGLIALRDDARPEAAAVLEALKASGIRKIVVLTGDHKDTAEALVRQLPQIDALHYELKPDDKAAIVKDLKDEGCTLAFVGDGVNDAPALVTAHVGICMPKGADLAREAAQVLLLHEDLHTLVVARQAAIRTNTIIRQTFGATIGCNSVIMLLATAGMSPVLAALLHNASTIGILGYAAMAASRPLLKRTHASSLAPRREEIC
ncbi:MAG: heavy metal translocating P-type ATPase, partial [Desulfovibrionaceae bacterium]